VAPAVPVRAAYHPAVLLKTRIYYQLSGQSNPFEAALLFALQASDGLEEEEVPAAR